MAILYRCLCVTLAALYVERVSADNEEATSRALSAAASLAREPLARIMYGQRELFHSNLLAWFFEELPEQADEVFRDFTDPGAEPERRVRREFQNLDLVFLWEGRNPLVIENKVFSLPDAAQLARYDEVIAKWQNQPRRLLLGVVPPSVPVPGWAFLDYRDLADRIEAALAADPYSYEVETMRHYARMIHRLVDLIDTTQIVDLTEDVWLSRDILSTLESNQLAHALGKLRGHRVATLLNKKLGGGVDASLSHGNPVLTWRRELVIEGNSVESGLQLQEGQLRRYLRLPHLEGRSTQHVAERESFAAAHPAFFDFSGLASAIGVDDVTVIPADSSFLRFNPDFVYRYAKVPRLGIDQFLRAIRWVGESVPGPSVAERFGRDLIRNDIQPV
jgi:hypothetical protein